MAALRPGRTTTPLERPWTRFSTKKTKSYVPTSPGSKIHVFNMGEPNESFDLILNLVVRESVQIRDNALEAARIVMHSFLDKKLPKAYFIKVLVYPHQIIREKPIAQGAGADRYSRGMKLAFGKPTRRACRVMKGQPIIVLKTYKSNIKIAKESLKRASSKLPTPTQIIAGE